MDRKMTLISCILWIAGVAAVIIGLNLEGNARTWVSVCGNIAFLVGLGLQGVLWLRKQKREKQKSADPEPSDNA